MPTVAEKKTAVEEKTRDLLGDATAVIVKGILQSEDTRKGMEEVRRLLFSSKGILFRVKNKDKEKARQIRLALSDLGSE